jgi:hypothetical protein
LYKLKNKLGQTDPYGKKKLVLPED